MTFDDWLEGQEEIIVPELIKRKLPATMFVTVQLGNWRKTAFPVMRLAHANGIEIANHTITHTTVSPTISMGQKTMARIEKTPKILERLQEIASVGFSPSSLTSYIRNPIDFIFRRC